MSSPDAQPAVTADGASPQAGAARQARYAFGAAVVAAGTAAGLGAALLTWVLHTVEELVYGHGEVHGGIVTAGVPRGRAALPVLAVAVLLAVGWWLLRGRGRPLAGVKKMVAGADGPTAETWLNALFQMVGVGAGLPVGREVAPREVAAWVARRLARWAALDASDGTLLVAAAAGAGLGAVYQVPVAGAVYAVELMVPQVTVRAVATCLATSSLAVVTSRVVVSPVPQYAAPALDGSNWRVLLCAVVVGLLLGIPGRWFGDVADHVKKTSQRGTATLATLPAAGLATALVAWWFPLVLGNGRSAAQAGFLGLSAGMAIAVLVLKCLCTFGVLRAGAVGGTLAPAIAAGSLSGVVLAHLGHGLPGLGNVPVGVVAVLGAVAVLSTSLRAPASGLLLIAGITGQPHDALLPLALCVAAAWGVSRLVGALPLGRGRSAGR